MNFNRIPIRNSAMKALVTVAAGLLPTAVLADEVTLKSADGTVNIVGEFVEFTDDNYVIRTGLGDLRISAARVRCEGDACPTFETASADVTIAGSDTVGLGLMPLLMSGFAGNLDAEASVIATQKDSEVLANFVADGGFGDEMGSYLISSTVSSDSFKALEAGTAEIGMASRRIKPKEARALKAAGKGNMINPSQEHILAVEALVVITHPSNPINTLEKNQLRDIYEGRITNWSQLGGDDVEIKVATRPDGSGTRSVYEDKIFLGKEANVRGDAEIATSHNDMAAFVNAEPGAIGFVGYAFQRGAKAMTVINHCGMPMEADAFSAKTEEYALNRRLYMYNAEGGLSDWAKEFVDYATSDDADGVIAKAGFISLGIDTKEQSLESARARSLLNPAADAFEGGVMREMLGTMVDHDRLSTTFRFRTGSSKLDERGRVDLARLADFLETKPAGTKVLLVGFTDDVGAFASNRNLSISRATQVQDAIRDFAGDRLSHIEFASTGYGEVSPAFCNDDENGRAINRRVEIWIGKEDRT